MPTLQAKLEPSEIVLLQTPINLAVDLEGVTWSNACGGVATIIISRNPSWIANSGLGV
jgi:hypothetical protein